MRAEVPAALRGLVPDPLPAAAHFDFACPFCQLAGTTTRCCTDAAAAVAWRVLGGEPPAVLLGATFTGVPCSTCGRTLTVKAQHDLRQPAAAQ